MILPIQLFNATKTNQVAKKTRKAQFSLNTDKDRMNRKYEVVQVPPTIQPNILTSKACF